MLLIRPGGLKKTYYTLLEIQLSSLFLKIEVYFKNLNYKIKNPHVFSSVAQLCPTLCNPMDCSMPDFPVHHQFLELAQTHVH